MPADHPPSLEFGGRAAKRKAGVTRSCRGESPDQPGLSTILLLVVRGGIVGEKVLVSNQEESGLWATGYGKGKKAEEVKLWVGLAVCGVFRRFY
jgi:hypothetical protein